MGGKGAIDPHPKEKNFELSENCPKIFFLSEKNSLKKQKLWLKNPHFGKIYGKIEILSTHKFRCQKFATVCRKNASSCPAYVFQPTTPLQKSDPITAQL